MAAIARHDFITIKGETFSEVVAVSTPIIDSCNLYINLKISENGKLFYTIPDDYITVADVNVVVDGGNVAYSGIQITIDADILLGIPALSYWYDLYVECATQKYVFLEGIFDLRTSTVIECIIPGTDTVAPDACTAVVPVISDVNETLEVCYARTDPLYFEILGTTGLRSISVDRPGGTIKLVANERGQWAHDPGMAIQSTKYRVEFYRYAPNWLLRKPWDRKGEFTTGSLACCSSYCPDDTPFDITISATDICGNTASQAYTIDINGVCCVSC